MDVFDFDPASYREQFTTQGWVHVRAKLWDRARILLTGPQYDLLQAIDPRDPEQRGSGAAAPGSGEIARRPASRRLIDLRRPA